MILDCGNSRHRKNHQRIIRLVEKLTANYLYKHPKLWGIDRQEAFLWVLREVWREFPKNTEAAKRVIFKALNRLGDESDKNEVRLRPATARKAEKDATTRGVDHDMPVQAALREFNDDLVLLSQESAFRDLDVYAVRWVFKKLSKDDKLVCLRHLRYKSVKKAAQSQNMSEKTYERHVWNPTRMRFRELWAKVDWKKLAEMVSSNPYICAGVK